MGYRDKHPAARGYSARSASSGVTRAAANADLRPGMTLEVLKAVLIGDDHVGAARTDTGEPFRCRQFYPRDKPPTPVHLVIAVSRMVRRRRAENQERPIRSWKQWPRQEGRNRLGP
jgi:hypothetical protein